MNTLLSILLLGVIGVMTYLVCRMSDYSPLSKKKRKYVRKEMPVKRMPTAVLIVYYAQGIREYPITDSRDGFCIGSAECCDLKIPKSESEYIDKEHALITLDEYTDQYVLTDLDSLNGIYDASQQRVETLILNDGVQFRIANLLMEYQKYHPFEKRGG